MLEHFSSKESTHIGCELFEVDHHDAPAVFGQDRTKKRNYQQP